MENDFFVFFKINAFCESLQIRFLGDQSFKSISELQFYDPIF